MSYLLTRIALYGDVLPLTFKLDYKKFEEGLKLFEHVKGDKDSIMGLPIKEIINYIKHLKK